MRHFWLHHSRWFAPTLLIAGFVAGAICTSWQPASAQQRFGKDDIKSVPKSFLDGGDRAYTTLKEIALTSKAAADALESIEKKVGDADKRHRELMKKIDSLDAGLKQRHAAMLDAL